MQKLSFAIFLSASALFAQCSGTTPLNIHPSLLINDCIPGRWNPTAYPGGGTNGALKELSDEAMSNKNTDWGSIISHNPPNITGSGPFSSMPAKGDYEWAQWKVTDAVDSLHCNAGGGTAIAFCTWHPGGWVVASAFYQGAEDQNVQTSILWGYIYQMYHRAGGHEAIANAYAAAMWTGITQGTGPTYHLSALQVGPGNSACGTLAVQTACATLSAPASPALTTGETIIVWGAPDDQVSYGSKATVIDSTHFKFGVNSLAKPATYTVSTMVVATQLWFGSDDKGSVGSVLSEWVYFWNWCHDWIVANGLQAYTLGQLEAGWWDSNPTRASSLYSSGIVESDFQNHSSWLVVAEIEAGPALYNDDPNIGAAAWALSQGLLYQGVGVQTSGYNPQTYSFNLAQSYAKIAQALNWEGIGYWREAASNHVRGIDAVETATGRNNKIWSTYFPNAWTGAMYQIYCLRPDGFDTAFGDTVWYSNPSGRDNLGVAILNSVHPDPHFVYFMDHSVGDPWNVGGSGEGGWGTKAIYYPYVNGPGSHDYTDLPKARQFGADIVIRDWSTANGVSSTDTQMTYSTGVHGVYHRFDDAGAFSLFKHNVLIGNEMDIVTEPTYTNFARTTWGANTITVVDPNDCYKQIGTTCGNVSDNGNQYVPNEGNQLMSERRHGPQFGKPNIGAGLSGTIDRIWTGNVYNDPVLGPLYTKTDVVYPASLGTGSAYESIAADLTPYYQNVWSGTGDNPTVKYSCTYDRNGLCTGGILDKLIHFHATQGSLDPVVRFMRVTSSNASFAKSLHFHTPSTAPIVNGSAVPLGDHTITNVTGVSATNLNGRVFIQPLLPANPSVRVLGGNTCTPIPISSCDNGNPTTCTATAHGLQVNEGVEFATGTYYYAGGTSPYGWGYFPWNLASPGQPGIGNAHYVTAVPDANHFRLNFDGASLGAWASTFFSGSAAPTNPAPGNPVVYYQTGAAGGNTVWMSDNTNTWRQMYGAFTGYPAGLGLTAPTIISHTSCNYTGHVDQQGPIGSGPANLWTDSMSGSGYQAKSIIPQIDIQVKPSSASTTDYFLTVLTPTGTGVSSAPTSTLLSGTGYYGALIADSRGYYVPVFPTSTTPVSSLTYTVTHSGTAQHVVAGLVPRAVYTITQNSTSLGSVTADASGSGGIKETGGGNFTWLASELPIGGLIR